MKKVILFGILVLLLFVFWPSRNNPPVTPPIPQFPRDEEKIKIVATNLQIPWEIEFLPNGDIIFTERPGRVQILNQRTHRIENVAHIGEGGLLGMTLHPNFKTNNFIYFYYTYREGERILNKVERFKLAGNVLQQDKVIIDNLPGSINHDGGRIKFGPDGNLYITTGDAGIAQLAQDRQSLAGKILRLNDDGTIPPDNPFPNSTVYSYGHRNPQGLAWDSAGQLWATEHGSSARDEINKIIAGNNYGWPITRGDEKRPGMETPFLNSGAVTWAPSGATIFDNNLLFAGLKGQAVFKLNLSTKELQPIFQNQYGRIRNVTVGPDGNIYIITSNRDGRGDPIPEDDRLIVLDPSLFE